MANRMRLAKMILFLIILSSCACNAQKLVQTIGDISKIQSNKDRFINCPLKYFLDEIGPPIKRVTASPSLNNNEFVGRFTFHFKDDKEISSLKSKGKFPTTIMVYVKENFDWDYHKRTKGKETVWTKEDAKKYGNLTVIGFQTHVGD